MKGTDLSKWNVINDYFALKKAGVEFAILKAINSSKVADARFETHVKKCQNAGIPVLGTYHYSYATDIQAAKVAATKWLQVCDGRFNRFYLDWEDKCLPKTSVAVDIINTYADIIRSAGFDMDLYAGYAYYNAYLKKYAAKLPYDLWIARYYKTYESFRMENEPSEAYKPAVSRLIGWQYTSSGIVPGANGKLDLNYWYETAVESTKTVTVDTNPYTEPVNTVTLGTTGNDANWVLWYLWRFGLLLDVDRQPDATRINGMIQNDDVVAIKAAQRRLGTEPDGKVGKVTRALFKKVC